MKTKAFIGLGSNLNRPLVQLREACLRLQTCPQIVIHAYSDIYQSKPLPSLWSQENYLNAVVSIETDLTPYELLHALKKIEHDMGRRPSGRWAARVIDLDILTFDDLVMDEKDLQIPHKELHNRSFALLPLLDILPHYQHPKYTALDFKNYHWDDMPHKIPHLLNGPKIMGILNITPDSFSDGGQFIKPEAAIAQAQRLFNEGADIIDVGAESTRPGGQLIDAHLEWQRLEPILKTIHDHWHKKENKPLISIDTRHAETVEKALAYDINWINDQSQAEFHLMAPFIKKYHLNYVAMHHCGLPPSPDRVVEGDPIQVIKQYQQDWLDLFAQHNLNPAQLIVDPGIGFGKTLSQQLQILKNSHEIRVPGVAYLVGHSRKSFIKGLLNDPDATSKEMATALISAELALEGVDYLRVHEPKMNLEAIRLTLFLKGEK